MNIEEYRAMKAEQERAEKDAQTQRDSAPPAETQQAQAEQVPSTSQEETKPKEDGKDTHVEEQSKPITVEIDGQEVTLDELKNGYLRQSDYTKKTQEARRKEREAEEALKLIEQLQQNPQVAQQLSQQFQLPNLDPQVAQVRDLQERYYDLLIQSEIRNLHDKYGDFEEREVLDIVVNENIENFDTAFHIMKSRKGGGEQAKQEVNVDELKAQLRDELLKEIKSQTEANVDTTSIIQQGGGSAPRNDNAPQLSQNEVKVARMMGMDAKEYAKWRDIKNKKK